MVQIRCTKKVYDLLGIKNTELNECKETDALLGNWYANIFKIERRKALIFMSEKTFYSFIILDVRKDNIKNIAAAFYLGLKQSLEREGFDDIAINMFLSDCKNIELTKTNSRTILGNLNDLVEQYKFSIYYDGSLSYCDIIDIIKNINRMPQRNLNWSTSFNKLMEYSIPLN